MRIFANMTKMAGTLLAILYTRIELFSVEIQEEAQRLLAYLILSLIALFCLFMTGLLAIFLIIIFFWDTYRIWSICGLMVFFGGTALLIVLGIRRSYRKKPKMLAYTRNEIANDIERLKSGG